MGRSAKGMNYTTIHTKRCICAEADARLIAAAPEMYEALFQIDRFVRSMVKDEGATGYTKALSLLKHHEGETWGNLVRAALAKARGES